MASRVVLISGAGRFLGGAVAMALAADPAVDRVVGVDTSAAAHPEVEFVRADIAHPLIGKLIDQAEVGTVVHLGRPSDAAGLRSLLRACERSRSVTRFVLASSTAVYGGSRRDPAVFAEPMAAVGDVPRGFARDAIDAERQVRTFAARRPDVGISVVRLAPLIGPLIDSWLTRYLRLRVVPTRLGFDPRVQLLHETDAVEVLSRAARGDHPGVTNVAGDGVLTLTQLLRRAARPRLPLPSTALRVAGIDAGWLTYGNVVDTSVLKTRFGYEPRYSTASALASFLMKAVEA
jgi:UDP-glucose 4-epimerase